jgi:hypothetical protein
MAISCSNFKRSYYKNDSYEWKDDLTSDFVTDNGSYTPFNPVGDAGYISAITNGFAALRSEVITDQDFKDKQNS